MNNVITGVLALAALVVLLGVSSPVFGHQAASEPHPATLPSQQGQLLAGDISGSSPSTEPAWPMFNAGPANTGHLDTRGPPPDFTVRWEFAFPSGEVILGIPQSPVVGDGAVYFGTEAFGDATGSIYAVDAVNETVRWNVDVGHNVRSTPAYVGGTVYVSTEPCNVYAIDSTTGNIQWRFNKSDRASLTSGDSCNPNQPQYSSPTVVGGTVYVGGSNGKVYAFDAETGTIEWEFDPPEDTFSDTFGSTPAVVNGTVYIGRWQDKLFALDAETGNRIWKKRASLRDTSPTVSDGIVYTANGLESRVNITARKADTGHELWTYNTGEATTPAVVDGTLYVGVAHMHGGSGPSNTGEEPEGHIVALDAKTGDLIWNVTVTGHVRSAPSVVDGTVYVGSDDDHLYTFDADTGTERWNFTTSKNVRGSPAVVGGALYFRVTNKMYALSTPPDIGFSDLSVSPDSVVAGESVTAEATVTNTGGFGSYNATLKVNGTPVASKTGTVGKGVSTTVSFAHTFVRAGTYAVTINNLTAKTVSIRPAWPQFRVQPARTGHTASTGPTQYITEDWNVSLAQSTLPTEGRVRSSPAIVNGTLAVGSDNDSVHGIDPATGDIQWRFDTGADVTASPALVNGTVYVGNTDGVVFAINANTGSETWRFDPGGLISETGITSSPVVVDGTVYVGSAGGSVYALDAQSGSKVWSAATGGAVQSSPAVVDDTVYVGSNDGNLYALARQNGIERWRVSTNGEVVSSPAVVAGTVYVAGGSYVYAINIANNDISWKYNTQAKVVSSPAVVGGTVYVGSTNGKVYALDAQGSFQWDYDTAGPVRSSPAVVGGIVYVGSNDQNVYALQATSGDKLWNVTTGGAVVSSPAVLDGTVFVGSNDGTLYAITEGQPPPTASPTPTLTSTPTLTPDSRTLTGTGTAGGESTGTGTGTTTTNPTDSTSTSTSGPGLGTTPQPTATAQVTPLTTPETPTPTPSRTETPPASPTPELVPGFGLGAWLVAFALAVGVLTLRRRDTGSP